ncbi:serine kinase [Dyadobacter sp. CY323]|uniref:serine kinase n=1 Tax=Dyadobacter sp. CY323 TaxID=2907302 RepID=UPI001F461659|nr:serine kinase [Dyadobacter sp. CY323]MCE6991607.1 serine kinase [Dyadobacter sp. CY323]
MHAYKAFGLNISSEIPLPELIEGDPAGNVDLIIKIGDFNLPKLRKTQIYRRGIRADFGQDLSGNLYLTWEHLAAFQASEGNVLTVLPYTQDPNLLSLFTVSEAMGLILFQKGYFLLHASSVLVGDEAWCFMGSPGAGKSTTAAAFIKAGCKLLSDDLTAIDFNSSNVPYIIPAYPQLKIWDKTVNGLEYDKTDLQPVSEGVNKFSYQPKQGFPSEPVRLGKIIFLHKARNKKSSQPLNAVEIPTELLKNFPLPVILLSGDALKIHFLQSFKCAKSADIIQKRRPEGFDKLASWVEESVSIFVNSEMNV